MKTIYDKINKYKKDTYFLEYNEDIIEDIIGKIRRDYSLIERNIISSSNKYEEFCDIYKGNIISSSEIIEEYERNMHRLAYLVIYKPFDSIPQLVHLYENFKRGIDFNFIDYLENPKVLNESYINNEKYKNLLSKIKSRYHKLITLMEISKNQLLLSDDNIKQLKELQNQEEIVKSLCIYGKNEINNIINEANTQIKEYTEEINKNINKSLIKSELYDSEVEDNNKLIKRWY